MGRRLYTQEQIKQLLANNNVQAISNDNCRIVFKPSFKLEAVKLYIDGGKTAREIFEEAGFDTSMFQKKYPSKQLGRWRDAFNKKGDIAFDNDPANKYSYRVFENRGTSEADINFRLHELEQALIKLKIDGEKKNTEDKTANKELLRRGNRKAD